MRDLFRTLPVACAVIAVCCSLSNAEEIVSFQIRAGTLEPVTEAGRRGYVFRWPGGEEWFVVSNDEFLRSKKVELVFPVPKGLRPAGFRLENGVEFLYQTSEGPRSELATAQAAAAQYPDVKAVARLFDGDGKSVVAIALAGPTAVFRTDLKTTGKEYTLWANRQPDKPAE